MSDCLACTHPGAIHADDGHCRITGCACGGFDDGTKEQPAPRARRVSIDVPDGYVLQFQLVPVEAAATAAEGS